jgi:hypothetical protein
VVGALLVAVSALADPLGIGGAGAIGYKQTIGMIVGAAIALGGLALALVVGDARTADGDEPAHRATT